MDNFDIRRQAYLGGEFERRLLEQQNWMNRTLARNLVHDAQVLIDFQVRDIVATAIQGATGEIKFTLESFSDLLKTDAGRNRSARMRRVYQAVADSATIATLDKYDATRSGKPSYRQGDEGKWKRYSGGKLRNALASGQLFRVGADGIAMNTGHLDDKARQWYRLNFGALPKGGTTPAPAPGTMIFFGSQSQPALSLRDYGPSKPFTIPQGVFSNDPHATSGGQKIKSIIPSAPSGDPFYAVGAGLSGYNNRKKTYRVNRRIASGINAGRFLEAGVNRINEELPGAISQLIQEWTFEAAGASFNKSGSSRNSGPSGPLAQQVDARGAKRMLRLIEPTATAFRSTNAQTAARIASSRSIFPI